MVSIDPTAQVKTLWTVLFVEKLMTKEYGHMCESSSYLQSGIATEPFPMQQIALKWHILCHLKNINHNIIKVHNFPLLWKIEYPVTLPAELLNWHFLLFVLPLGFGKTSLNRRGRVMPGKRRPNGVITGLAARKTTGIRKGISPMNRPPLSDKVGWWLNPGLDVLFHYLY